MIENQKGLDSRDPMANMRAIIELDRIGQNPLDAPATPTERITWATIRNASNYRHLWMVPKRTCRTLDLVNNGLLPRDLVYGKRAMVGAQADLNTPRNAFFDGLGHRLCSDRHRDANLLSYALRRFGHLSPGTLYEMKGEYMRPEPGREDGHLCGDCSEGASVTYVVPPRSSITPDVFIDRVMHESVSFERFETPREYLRARFGHIPAAVQWRYGDEE